MTQRVTGTLVLVSLWAFGWVPLAAADVQDFTVQRFSAEYRLTTTDPQGALHVTERLRVAFQDQNHGLLRAIPSSYKGHRLQLQVHSVTSDTGAPAVYEMYTSSGNNVLKIGDPSRTVTGEQDYTISYSLRNVIGFYDTHDEFYWDINGDQWQQQFQQVSATLHLPGGVSVISRAPECYTGNFGGTDRTCWIAYDQVRHTVTVHTTGPLDAGQTLTMVAGFTKGGFRPASFWETIGEYSHMLLAFCVPLLIIAGAAGVLWFRHGRDAKGRGVIVPHYDVPDNLKPLEVGTLADFRADHRDITATIIDLAIRRYITIIEQKKERRLRRDLITYTLRLEKTSLQGLTLYEASILKALFTPFQAGQAVDLAALQFSLAQTAQHIRTASRHDLTVRGYFRSGPSLLLRLGLIGLIIPALVIAAVTLSSFHASGAFAAGAIIGALIACMFYLLLPSRTSRGVAAREHILGLKVYLETAEADRLKMLESPGAPYRTVSPDPKHTAALFEKLLPYAMALGVEKAWAAQFRHAYRTPPDWYRRSGHAAYTAVYLGDALAGGIQSGVHAAFQSPGSASGSGFSGGSAGGGGGGGGGGGW